MRATIRRQPGHLLRRIKRAWRVLISPEPALAVIYDYRTGVRDDDESYYGYFANREEALKMFNDAYPDMPNEETCIAHNAYLVEIVEQLRPYRD